MARKRTSLATLLEDSETTPQAEPAGQTRREAARTEVTASRAKEAAPAPQPAPPPGTGGRRAHVKQQTVYLPLPVYEQLRRLAFEERAKMHSLLMEGLDRVFKDRGLSSIADLERQKHH